MDSDDFFNPNEYKALITLFDKEFDYDASLKTYTEKIKAILADPKSRQGHWTRDRIQTMIGQIIKNKNYPILYQNLKFAIFDKELDVAELNDNDEKILVFANTCVQILPYEDCFDVLAELHRRLNHAGVDRMSDELHKHYFILKIYLDSFLQSCNSCEKYRNMKQNYLSRSKSKKPIDLTTLTDALYKELAPNIDKYTPDNMFNDTVKIDFLNMTLKPDEDFQHILVYCDNATQYILLRPMVDRDQVEVAMEIFRIITDFGPPKAIETSKVKLFENVIKMLQKTPIDFNTTIIPGSPEVKRNSMLKKYIYEWMENSKTPNWATGCYIVQSYWNLSGVNKPIGNLFGEKALKMVSTPKFDQSSLWKMIADKPRDKSKDKDKGKLQSNVMSRGDEPAKSKDSDDDDDDNILCFDDENDKLGKPSTSSAKDSSDLNTIKCNDMNLNVCFKCKRPIYFEPYKCIACKKFYHCYCAFESLPETGNVSPTKQSAILCYMCQVSYERQDND